MTRTKLSKRSLPTYTRGEEIFNTVSHIVGGSFGILVLITATVYSALTSDAWSIVSAAIYGVSMVVLYTASSIYHGLRAGLAKKVFQVIDHCTIYFLIAGTYTPVLLTIMRREAPAVSWMLFAVVWGLAALGAIFTAIDLKKYSVFSMICYIGMGWCILFAAPVALKVIPISALLWLLFGGISYTIGAVLYGLGRKKKYMHSLFHLLVVLGSILQFVAVMIVL